jgi:general secretion pathway protein K
MRDRRANQRGVALLLVLWIFMILGVLALDFARYMRDDAMAAVNFADETRGYYIALAGMNRAIWEAEQRLEDGEQDTNAPTIDPDEALEEKYKVPPDGDWHDGNFAGGGWSVRVVDEASRLSLNRMATDRYAPSLRRIVTNILTGGESTEGLDRQGEIIVNTVVDSILDWRDEEDELKHGPRGAESAYYLKLRPPYRARNGKFESPEELLLVRGVTSELFYGREGAPGLRDIFSVYGHGKLNICTAKPAVLQVVLGVQAWAIEELLQQRGEISEEGTCDDAFLELMRGRVEGIDPAMARLLTNTPPKVVSIEARGDIREQRNQSYVAAVVDLRPEASDAVHIKRWLDRAPWTGSLPSTGARPEDAES